jgi:hypothetical protein
MGNSTIKRQILIAVVTLSFFVLGSVGVATAGLVFDNIVTKLEGKFKGGKEWCGPAVGMALGDAVAEKEKIKEDVTVWVEFSDFPVVEAFVNTPGIADIFLDGFAVRKNDKKGFFSVTGDLNDGFFDGDILNPTHLSMEGKYKVNDLGVPIKLKGTFQFFNALSTDAGEGVRLIGEVCVTNGGKFNVSGDGGSFGFGDLDEDD